MPTAYDYPWPGLGRVNPHGPEGVADVEQIPMMGAAPGTARMEAFSDGVLAIAITLLVLDLALRPPGSPPEQFLRIGWPTSSTSSAS